MNTESRRTTFFGLTNDGAGGGGFDIERIEIPRFQRDFAQGRKTPSVARIRAEFLDALFTAVGGDRPSPAGLDFVYGGVENGVLRPLDGQQRLTTLFLLHWYLASLSGQLTAAHGWKRFSYETRQSARMFCERLVEAPLPGDEALPSAWITDQPWYLFGWRHDPTIQSMLVMIDAIHERFEHVDAVAAWAKLTDFDDPAIWFLLLPLSRMGPAEELYIKMNSRGKPLTEFENFKAHFEKTIGASARSSEFAVKVDTTWSDLLWDLRGDDDLIDDEFLRYMEFVIEVCEWRDGRADGARQRIDPRSRAVFGGGNPRGGAHLDFLFDALDAWVGRRVPGTFDEFFTGSVEDTDASKVRLFFRTDGNQPLNLFEACCRSYGETRGRARVFSLGQALILYAVVLHLVEDTPDFRRRVRVLRNLIEASSDELRLDRMPKILEDVHSVIRHGRLEAVTTLNNAQVEDEKLKAAFLAENPGLQGAVFGLEDHELLRGSLGAFELDAGTFERRAAVFHRLMSEWELWPELTRALLATGEYQRQRTNARSLLFGTDSKRHDGAWRELLTGANRERLGTTRAVLAKFFDLVDPEEEALGDFMRAITSDFLARCERERRFDWRYYMVKYPSMRGNGSSTYYAERFSGEEKPSMGYSLCMLRAGGSAINGYYRDPYLLAICEQLADRGVVEDQWFTGYETSPRRLPLTRSGAALRCVPSGFQLSPPPEDHTDAFEAACGELDASVDHLVRVRQEEVDGRAFDAEDRIQIGVDIVHRMVAAGL